MSQEKKELLFDDVAIALDIVGLLLNQLTIPASRAQEFAVTGAVIAELRNFVDAKIKSTQAAPAEPSSEEEAPSETSPETEEA
jgi:hypothetical protein